MIATVLGLISESARLIARGGRVAAATIALLALVWLGLAAALGAAIALPIAALMLIGLFGGGHGVDVLAAAFAVFGFGAAFGVLFFFPLVIAGPLATFALCATSDEPVGIARALALVRRRWRPLVVSYHAAWLFGGFILSMAAFIADTTRSSSLTLLYVAVSIAAIDVGYAFSLFPAHVLLALEGYADFTVARARVDQLVRGRRALFLAAVILPQIVLVAARPSSIAIEWMKDTIGMRGATTIIVLVGIAGALLAAFVHAALAAAAHAIAAPEVGPSKMREKP